MTSLIKPLLVMGICCSFLNAVYANERSQQERDAIALESLVSLGKKNLQPTDINVIATSADFCEADKNHASFFVYGYADNAPGYVIVSADDVLPAVLGFSETERFHIAEKPEDAGGLCYMLNSYALTKENENMFRQAKAHTHSAKTELKEIAPLLGDIAFDQGAPYNEMCPKVYMGDCENGTPMPTGCVATAAAQIMAYYKWPLQMTGKNISYISYSHQIPITWEPESTYFNWHNIMPFYKNLTQLDVEDYTFGDPIMGVLEHDWHYGAAVNLCNGEEKLHLTLGCPFEKDFACALQVWIAEEDGTLIQPVSKISYFSIQPRTSIIPPPIDFFCPTTLVDGNYRLYYCTKIMGTEEWHLCLYNNFNTPEYYDKNYLELTKTGSTYSIAGYTFSCKDPNVDDVLEISKLNAAIGAAVEMDYTSTASGSTMPQLYSALINNFGYDKDMKMVERQNLSDASVHTCLKNELDAGRPVYLAGGNHAFVLDGCKPMGSNVYYHINWGWGGRSNGYYLIDYLTPEASGIGGNSSGLYNDNLIIIVGVQPENGIADYYDYK